MSHATSLITACVMLFNAGLTFAGPPLSSGWTGLMVLIGAIGWVLLAIEEWKKA